MNPNKDSSNIGKLVALFKKSLACSKTSHDHSVRKSSFALMDINMERFGRWVEHFSVSSSPYTVIKSSRLRTKISGSL